MGKIRRGGYLFVTFVGDHPPRHVHVYRNGKLIVKWNLDSRVPMWGDAPLKLFATIRHLEAEGLL